MESPMRTRYFVAIMLAMIGPNAVWSQPALHFRWQKGQILTYKVTHVTAVTEVVRDTKQQFGSRLDLTKRYRVADVDGKGLATLEYSVTAMRNEQTRPNGEVLLFDSADPVKSTPGLREQLAKYVGTTLAVIRVDAVGQVIEVKQGPADRYGAEPPFALVLPPSAVEIGQVWTRAFDLTLDPPLGTGEKYKAQQECRCKKLEAGKATIALATTFKTTPESVQERLPLLQKEVQGEVVFDMTAGRVADVRLTVDRTLANHQGPGSSYHFESTYS
jgi:hypothetical protein